MHASGFLKHDIFMFSAKLVLLTQLLILFRSAEPSYFRFYLFKLYLLLASVNENHEMYMKDSMSAAEVGTGQYITTKGISQTNLITTVTPEKKAEEERDEEEGKKKEAEITPVSAIRHDTKV